LVHFLDKQEMNEKSLKKAGGASFFSPFCFHEQEKDITVQSNSVKKIDGGVLLWFISWTSKK